MIVVRGFTGFDCRQGWRRPLARVVPVVAVLLGLLAGSQANAAIECIAPDNGGGSVDLPPLCPGGYLSPDEVHMVIDNADPGTTIILDATHDEFILRSRTPGGTLGGEVEQFDSLLLMNLSGTGALAGFTYVTTVPVSCEVHTAPRVAGDPVQSFDTEMVQLQGTPPDDGVLCSFQVVAGGAFGLPPSTGHTTLTQQSGGNWSVDSFFDITYQIDFVGCPGGALAGLTFSGQQTIRMQAGLPSIEAGDDEYMTIDPTSIHFGGADVPTIPIGLLGNSAPIDVVVPMTGGGSGLASLRVRRSAPLPLPEIPSTGVVQTEIVSMDLVSKQPIQIGVDSFFDVFVRLDTDAANPSLGTMQITRTDESGGVFSCETNLNAIVEFRDVGNPTAPPIPMQPFPLHLSTQHDGQWSHTPPPGSNPSIGTGPNFYPRGIEHEDIGVHMQSDGLGVVHNIDAPVPDEACCAADGTCQNLPPNQCRLNNGVPRGPGTACAGVDADGNGRDDACEFDLPCQDCGPGSHWIDTCQAGLDYMPSGAPIGLDLDFDCLEDTNVVLSGPVVVARQAGSPHTIDTEIVSMSLTGGGITLRAGAGNGQGGVLPPTLGSIVEQGTDATQGDSFFDVFFEVDLGGGQFAYNHQPLTVTATIPCVPPDALYFHPISCIPLYASPTGVCALSGTACRADSDCDAAIGETCDHGLPVAQLTSANHDTYPPCPLRNDATLTPLCKDRQAKDCTNGSADQECRATALVVNPVPPGGVVAAACECIVPGPGCGPIELAADGDTVSCPGTCQPPDAQGPCVIFFDDGTGGPPISTGQTSASSIEFPPGSVLTCGCEPAGEPNEACCAADGTCQNLPASQCLATDGTPRGPGTACAGVDADGNGRDDACEFSQPCQDCGPGAHWIDTCPGGLDYMPSGAPVGIDLNLDCIQDQTLVLQGPVAINRGPGSPHQIDTEIVSMSLTGGGVTLRAGAGNGQGGVLPPSLGAIVEQNSDPTMGDSFFDVFFELDLGGGTYAYNHQPLTVQAAIPCVPPDTVYFHPLACIPLYDRPSATCSLSGGTCVVDSDCPTTGETCDHGVEIARLTKANHDTYPECGTPTADGQACAQFKCTDGTTDPCQPRCAEYDPVTGITNVIDCDCRPIDECHVDFTPATGGVGGLRAGTDNPCTRPDDGSGTIKLPPEGCAYLSAAEVHAILGDPPITVQLELDPIHEGIFCGDTGAGPRPGCPPPGVCETPGGALGGNTDCFESNLHLVITGNDPPLAGYNHTVDVPVSCLVYSAPRTPGDPVQSFDTEMFRLQGELFGDTDFCTFRVTAGREAGLPSPGHTTLTKLPSGDFQVDSFFDITYQIDFQGCTGGPLDGYAGSTTGTIRMATGTPPVCTGGCPAGEICNERKDVDPATGLMTICCDCIPEPTGACCRGDGTCAVTTAANCAAPDQYLGDGTVCQDIGACCLDVSDGPAQFETCQMISGTCCELAGGVFDATGTCTTMACCLPGGFCEDLDPECCVASGGVVSGNACAATSCTPQDCQVGPTGLCEQVACAGGTTDQCQAKCVSYDPKTGATAATLCDCVPGDDCYVVVDQPVGGLRGGDPCVLPDGPTPGTILLPPVGCDYLSPDEVHMIVAGLPVPTTIELAAIHKDFVCGPDIQCSSPAAPPLTCESNDGEGTLGGKVDCFGSVLDLTVRGTGTLSGFSRHLFVPVETEVHTAPRTPGDAVQEFDTEMFRISGELFGDPDFCTFRVSGGSSVGLPSPGHTTLTRLSGGDWQVDSFFDITYQIDFQGCPGSILEGFAGTTEGSIHMETGGMPGCSDTCPAGSICEQTKTFDAANDTFEICCNCKEIAPTPVPARPPYDRKMNRTLAWDPNTGGRALANPIAYRVELKQVTQGSCNVTGGFCRVDRKECSISGSPCNVDADCGMGEGTCSVWSDCNLCSIDGNACITAPIDCAPGQTCDPTGETCVNDAPDVGGTSVGTVWWVGPECPPGSGQHLLVPEAFRLEATNWPSPTLAGDCETVPEAVYGIRALDINTATLSGELPVATTLFAPISSSFWADCVGPLKKFCGGDINGTACSTNADCVAPDTCDLAWTLPDGSVNFDDVNATLRAWTLPPGVAIPPIEWVDLLGNACGLPGSQNYDPPNHVINASDVQAVIFGFSGRPYTFYDAADCPATTHCGGVITGTPCTSNADCTAPDTCQVVCCSQ